MVGRVRQPPISPISPILVGVGGGHRKLAPLPQQQEVFARGGAELTPRHLAP